MTNLQKNIDYYMQLKNIKTYSHLLRRIALELNYTVQDSYEFANREKANFSKMLNGKRPLKYEYILPLEKIFGVSLARMLDEDAFKMPVDKKLVPYTKGVRYYAYLDDKNLYEKELVKLLNKDGKSIIESWDEFGKTFLDYVVEFKSENGVRFLHDFYKLKLRHWNNQFDTEPRWTFVLFKNPIGFCRMVADMGDLKLFNDIYDVFYLFALCGYYLPECLYSMDDYFEIVMNHKYLFNDLFEIKKYDLHLGPSAQRRQGREVMSFSSISPVINGCLNYALKRLNKYRKEAIEILKFGIGHNEAVMKGLPEFPNYCFIDEIGGLRLNRSHDIFDIAIIAKTDGVKDNEILELIDKLPKFNKEICYR